MTLLLVWWFLFIYMWNGRGERMAVLECDGCFLLFVKGTSKIYRSDDDAGDEVAGLNM